MPHTQTITKQPKKAILYLREISSTLTIIGTKHTKSARVKYNFGQMLLHSVSDVKVYTLFGLYGRYLNYSVFMADKQSNQFN